MKRAALALCLLAAACSKAGDGDTSGATADGGADAAAQLGNDASAQLEKDATAQPDDDATSQPDADAAAQPDGDAAAQPDADAAAQPADASQPANPDAAVPDECASCPADMVCGPDRRCVSACIPTARATTEGGGRCGDLSQAWTARGINVGYYAFRVRAPIEMYSGDYSGPPGAVFTPGGAGAGVLLQIIPAGAYVGLSSSGPWYDPPTGCFPSGEECGAPFRSACSDSSPPRRPELAGFAWGYAYSGASHMQGWIPADFTRLVFAGFDANHPCAFGPAGADFEASTACGRATSCRVPAGTSAPTCASTNKCDEGQDDCGRLACGAMSGGELTPSAHRMTVTRPSGHACTDRTPPHPNVTCLANGNERDFFFVYPFGAYLYWAQNSTTKHWLHYGDRVQAWYHTRDAQGVLWDFVEVLSSGAPILTPPSAAGSAPCANGGTCGWVQDVFLR